MIVNGERALAYIVNVDSVTPIEGADNIELAHVGGWTLITNIGQFKEGDEAVLFEIDSLLPETEWSEFLRPKKFRIKTLKLNKFGVWSQGLLMPMDILPKGKSFKVGDDVTKVLGVKYYVAEDNERKAKNPDSNQKYNRMCARNPKLAQKPWFKWFMKRMWGRKLLFVFFGRKDDNPKKFPQWIKRTDEERIENCMFMLDDKSPYVVSEKIDGTSLTAFLDLTGRKPDFGVCSRNVRQIDMYEENFHTGTAGTNVYWEAALRYDLKTVCEKIAKETGSKRVVIQGEVYGEGIQGNPLHIDHRDLAVFNLVLDCVRFGSIEARDILAKYGVPFVPILDESFTLPDKEDFEGFKLFADGKSVINKKCLREGIVCRSQDGQKSFKNVSRKWLMKHE